MIIDLIVRQKLIDYYNRSAERLEVMLGDTAVSRLLKQKSYKLANQKQPMINCGFCNEPYPIIHGCNGDGCAATADQDGVKAYEGSCFDLNDYAWAGEAKADCAIDICDKCIQKLLDNEEIYLVREGF
jgi:hypothetical protein